MIFPSIPLPKEDLKSILETCLTMKRTLEMLTGQDQGQTFAPHVFVQTDPPEALHVGDFWLCTALGQTFNIWNGNIWIKLADVAAVTTQADDLGLTQFARRRHR